MAKLEIRPLDAPLGAEVVGGSPTLEFDADEIAQLKAAMATHHLLVLRGEPKTEAQLLAFGHLYGWLRTTPDLAENMSRPLVSKVSHDPSSPSPIYRNNDFEWHTDGSMYVGEMGKETLLHGDIIPKIGGNTCVVSTYEIYDALPNALKARLDGVRVAFDGTAYRGGFSEVRKLIVHPLVVTHPDSGQRALYVQPYITSGILDLPAEEGADLMVEIIDRVLQPGRVYEHKWTPGDLLIIDDIGTWHRRNSWNPQEIRELSLLTTHIRVPVFSAPPDAPSTDDNDTSLLRYDVNDQTRASRDAALAWAGRQRQRILETARAASR